MSDISRRSFLKMLGMAGIVLAAPMELLLPFQKSRPNLISFGDMRIVTAYDILYDEEVLRYDIRYRDQQLFVAASLRSPEKNFTREEFLERIHKPMVAKLNEQLLYDNVQRSELVRLEYPSYYEEPEWVKRLILGENQNIIGR